MTWEQNTSPQLALSASLMTSSRTISPSLPLSNEPERSSSDSPRTIPDDATNTRRSSEAATLSARALVRSRLVTVGSAAPSSRDARSTAERELQPTHTGITTARSMDSMLSIPRPKTRSECGAEARPCPWVACRHHLAIEVSKAKPKDLRDDPRATTIRLNRPPRGRTKLGRRTGIAATAAASLVREWIEDAIELLAGARYTCSLDVVDDYPDGIPPSAVAWILGLTEPTIDQELRKPHVREALEHLREYLIA